MADYFRTVGAGQPVSGVSIPIMNPTVTAKPVMAAGYFDFVERLNSPNGTVSLTMNWVYFIFKVIIAIFTILGLVLAAIIAAGMFSYDGPDFKVFLTNTFYTTQSTDNNVSWTVLTQPVDIQNRNTPYTDIKFEHFYECMYYSHLAYDAPGPGGSCKNDTLVDYTSCAHSRYDSLLTSCTSGPLGWPTSNQYTSCVNIAMGGNRKTLNALRTCVRVRPWPLFEVPQEVDSPLFLGCFSWPLVMLTGFILFVAFGVYTVYPVDWEDVTYIEYGKPIRKMGLSRMGLLWLGLAALIAIGWAIVGVLISFRTGSAWPDTNATPFPGTQSTNILVVSSSAIAVFYFLIEFSEYFDRKVFARPEEENRPKAGAHMAHPMSMIPGNIIMNAMGYTQGTTAAGGGQLGYYFPDPTAEVVVGGLTAGAAQYTPVLLRTWADAYLFDVLFCVGAVGATLQLRTAEIYNIFFSLVCYRIAQMGMVRMIYESYVRGNFESGATNREKDQGYPETTATVEENVALCTKINALALQFASICALMPLALITSNKYGILVEFKAIQDFIMYGVLLPEVLRVAGHLFLLVRTSFKDGGKGVYILVFSHFLWMWDLGMRVFFLYLYFYGSSDYVGTKPFLVNRLQLVNATLGDVY